MRTCYAIIFLFYFIKFSAAQVVIDQSDMPAAGDTLRVSITTVVPGDYRQAGAGQVWDFTGLTRMSQRVESFVDVMQTPNLFWFTFIPNVTANLATPGQIPDTLTGLPFSDYYTFFKNTTQSFVDAGSGFLLTGIPIALKYNSPDVLYPFPCAFGNEWNSSSSAALALPGFAYFGTERTRHSAADAWGTLKTPFGTFETLRVRSDVVEYDSIYVDTLGIGIPVQRIITEYRWLGKGQGIPLLQISEEALATTVVYRDNAAPLGINEGEAGKARVFPNPATGSCMVDLSGIDLPATLRIMNISGSVVFEREISSMGNRVESVALSAFPAGYYLLVLKNSISCHTEKLIIIK